MYYIRLLSCLLFFVVGASAAASQYNSLTYASNGGSTYIIAIQNTSVIEVRTAVAIAMVIEVKRYEVHRKNHAKQKRVCI